MGLWDDVYLTDSGPLALRHPHVVSKLDLPSLDAAQLTRQRRGLEHHRRAGERHRAGRHRGRSSSRRRSRSARRSRPTRPLHARATSPGSTSRSRGSGGRTAWARRTSTRSRSTWTWTARSPTARSVRFGIQQMSSELTPEGPSAVQGERQADPDPRRRLGLRHDVPPRLAGAARDRDALRAGDGPQHDPPRGQARERPVLRARRPARDPGDARAGAAATSGSTGRSGTPRTTASRPRRSRARSCGCATTRACIAWFNGSDFHPPADVEKSYLEIAAEARLRQAGAVERHRPGRRRAAPPASRCSAPTTTSPPSYWLDRHEARRRVRLRHRDRPRRRGAADREPEADAAAGSALADQRVLDVPRGRRRVQGPAAVHGRARGPLRQGHAASRTTPARRRPSPTKASARCSRPTRATSTPPPA